MGNHSAGRSRRPRFGRNGAIATAVLLGLLGSGAFVWQGTNAAFTATTQNASNTWSTGSVALTDDDSNGAMFTASNLVPGSTGSKCIAVTYTSAVASTVKLYASAYTDTNSIGQYLDITIDEGTVGTFSSCGAFSSAGQIYSGTLANFDTTKLAFASGVGTWAPSSTATRVYKITYTLNASTPDAAQGKTTNCTFTWEARTT